MASVSIISFSLRDDAGKRASLPIYVPATATAAQLSALADALAPLVDGVTGAVIESISITQAHDLPAGLKVVTVADALNGMGALFNFDVQDTPYSHSIFVPAFRPLLIDNGEVIRTDTAVVDFVTGITDGTADADPSDRYANDILLLNGVEVKFRKS